MYSAASRSERSPASTSGQCPAAPLGVRFAGGDGHGRPGLARDVLVHTGEDDADAGLPGRRGERARPRRPEPADGQDDVAVGGPARGVQPAEQRGELRLVVRGVGGRVLDGDPAAGGDELAGHPEGVVHPGAGDEPGRQRAHQQALHLGPGSHAHEPNRSGQGVCVPSGAGVAAPAWQEN